MLKGFLGGHILQRRANGTNGKGIPRQGPPNAHGGCVPLTRKAIGDLFSNL